MSPEIALAPPFFESMARLLSSGSTVEPYNVASTQLPVQTHCGTMTGSMVRHPLPTPSLLTSPMSSPGLIRWKFVIHCFVDGYSRFVTGIRVHPNNRAASVLQLFLASVRRHGIPSRVRGDHGTENLRVAEWMEHVRGVSRGSYIWGR